MADENIRTTLQFQADIADFKAAMQEANRAIKLANSEFRAASSGMDDWAGSTDGLRAKLRELATVQAAQQQKLAALRAEYDKVVASEGESSRAAQELAIRINNQQAALNKTGQEIKSYTGKLEEVEEGSDDAGRAAQEAGEAAERGADGWSVMRDAIADIVANVIQDAISKIGDLARSVINLGMDFTSSMSEVQAISGATAEELEQLEATAREYGATTVFSASEAADALKYMALAGWDVAESTAGLPGVLNLAAASGMDLAAASDMVTDYLSAFGMQASDAAYMADLMAYAQSNANTTAEQLGEAFKNCAANLNAAGQDIETTTALLSMMANQGLKGSEAGTALTAIMRDMTTKMKDGAIQIGDTSVAVMDSEGNFRDLTDILIDVEAATAGMGDAERAAALMTTFTADSIKGLNLIMNAGTAEAAAFEGELRGATGTAEEMSATMNDNLSGDIKEMQSALEELGLKIFDKLEEPLRSVVQWITDNLNPAFNWVVENKDILLAAISGIAAGFVAFHTAAAVGNLISGFQQFFSIIKSGQGVMAALNAVMNMNPIGLVAIAIAGLVAAFVLLWSKCEGFRDFFINMWENIKGFFAGIVEWFANAGENITGFFVGAWDAIKKAWASAGEWFSGVREKINNAFSNVGNWFSEKFTQAKDLAQKAWSGAKKHFASVKDGITGAFSNFDAWMGDKFGGAWTAVKKAFSPFVGYFQQIWNTVKGIFSVVKSVLSGNFSDAWAAIKGIFAGWGSYFSGLWQNVKDIFAGVGKWFVNIGSNIVDGIWSGISGGFNWIKDKITGWVGNVLDFVKGLFGIHSPSTVFRDEVGKMLGAGMAEGIMDSRAAVNNAVQQLSDATLGGLASPSAGTPAAAAGKSIVFNQYNNSPKALTRREIYRQTFNALSYAGGG